MEQMFDTVNKLLNVIQNMQKCFECTICLHTISDPVKTLCGHRFCRVCIQTVLKKKSALCPLCNTVLQRRSISTDEHMQIYIDRLGQLIEAIQADSGIDITPQLGKAHVPKNGNCSFGTVNYKDDAEEYAKPGCSNVDTTTLQKQPQTESSATKDKKKLKQYKDKRQQKETADITKYLSKYSLSGVEPLSPNESNDHPDDKSISSSRVHSWLKELPEALEDPDKIASLQPVEYDLDDTLTISVSQNCNGNKLDNYDELRDEQRCQNLQSLVTKSSCRSASQNNDENEATNERNERNERNPCRTPETRCRASMIDEPNDPTVNPRPGTSGTGRSNEKNKEKSQERSSDVQRTSPSDMLPVMKKNWCSVVQFGKEMRSRKRRRKLRSLNISVGRKGRSPKKRAVKLKATRDTRQRCRGRERNASVNIVEAMVDRYPPEVRSTSNVVELCQGRRSAENHEEGNRGKDRDPNASVNIRENVADVRRPDERSLPNIENTRTEDVRNREDETSPRNKSFGSTSEGNHAARESSFITLDEGQQVRILNLNNHQMSDIIGVASMLEDQRPRDIDASIHRDQDENTLPLKKRRNLSNTPPFERLRSPVQATPTKSTGDVKTVTDSNEKPNRPLTNESCFASGYESPTIEMPNRHRLSLKRRSNDVEKNDTSISNVATRSLSVKRDLSRQIDRSEEDDAAARGNDATKTTSRTGNSPTGDDKWRDKREDKRVNGSSVTANEFARRKRDDNKEARSLVTFKKLGKIYKLRKKPVSFLYLGTTRRKSLIRRNYPLLGSDKPCNPVQSLDEQDVQCPNVPEGTFGESLEITVNDTATSTTKEIVYNAPASNTEPATEEETASRGSIKGIDVEEQDNEAVPRASKVRADSKDSMDIVFVSLNKNEETQPHVERNEPTSIEAPGETAPDVIKLLSPSKDSQLKFLSLGSPAEENLAPMFDEPEVVDVGSPKRGSFSEISLARSRVLNDRSRRTSDSSELDSPARSRKKRKRSKTRESIEEDPLGTKRKSKINDNDNDHDHDHDDVNNDDEDNNSNHSFSSKATCIRSSDKGTPSNKDERFLPSIPSTRHVETVSLSSDTDVANIRTDRAKEQKKGYRRIVQLASSDTDSPDIFNTNNGNSTSFKDPTVVSPTCKRKRATSPDSDCEADLKMLVSNWCEGLNTSDRCKKKGKLERDRDSSDSSSLSHGMSNASLKGSCSYETVRSANKMPLPRRQLPEFATKLGSQKSNCADTKQRDSLTERRPFDEDSPDFAEIIDRIQDIRNSSMVSEGRGSRPRKDISLMQDNFDEIMANVDTEALVGEYSKEKRENERNFEQGSSRNSEHRGLSVSNVRSAYKGGSHTHRLSSSDKENKYKDTEVMGDSESDNDDTLVHEYVDLGNKILKRNKSQERSKMFETTGERSLKNSSESSRLSMHNTIASSKEKHSDKSHESVACDYEQDSLMNITQHQLQIKEFEEDLFSKAKSSKSLSEMKEQEQRTPRKLKNKDTEHSTEEDDIVENTPDTKTKNIQFINSPPVSSITSSISRTHDEHYLRTPPSVVRKTVGTPNCRRSIHPLCQSTPKVQPSVLRNLYEPLTKSTTNVNESSVRRARNTTENGQNVSKQRPCFVCSGLMATQIEQVKGLAQIMNAKYLAQFEPEVTHVIVKIDEENNGANKTLKYLQGIAHRKWIVSYQWVVDSLRERKLANEEKYEAVDSGTLEAGPRNSRLRQKDLFEGFVFFFVEPYVDISLQQYQDLVRATGATVVDSLDALAAEKRRLKIIAIQADVHDYQIIEWYQKARAVPIIHDWVVECISQYRLISLYAYLQELSRQDVLALGYPEFLVEEDPEGESDSAYDASL